MLFAPFLFIYVLICLAFLAGLFILIQIDAITYAYSVLGLSPKAAVLALLASLIGSYINIPLYTVESGPMEAAATVNNFGVLYSVPFQHAGSQTTVAINMASEQLDARRGSSVRSGCDRVSVRSHVWIRARGVHFSSAAAWRRAPARLGSYHPLTGSHASG